LTPGDSFLPHLSAMSLPFGVGIGDVIAVTQLALNTWKSCRGAPQDFRNISGEVSGLHTVLSATDKMIASSSTPLSENQKLQLQSLVLGCRGVLTDLQALLDRFKSMGSQSIRTFERLRWSPPDVDVLRQRIISNTVLLDAFNGTVHACVALVLSIKNYKSC
jgi:hypothetical protein